MKKFIVGALALAAIGFGTIVAANATAGNGPNMAASTTNNTITTYKNMEFDIDITLDTGIIKSKETADKKINNVRLRMSDVVNFDVVSVEGTAQNYPHDQTVTPQKINGEVIGGSVDLGSFDYKYKHETEGANPVIYMLAGPKVSLTVKLKAKTAGTFDLKDKIMVDYVNADGNKGSALLGSAVNVTVTELAYQVGTITAEQQETGAVITPILGQYFDLNYTINPGQLVDKATGQAMPMEEDPRNMIYVVDKGAIDKVGSNEETARDSIIKSLEELNQSNPETQVSLVVYGEGAEVVKVNDKSTFTITELISQISNIEATEKSGNLGDAIRMTQVLINETEVEDSVILVSNGDSSYYTQVSEGNSATLSTRVDKQGFAVEDNEKAEDYANDVVKDIVINETADTRWYAVNYGLEKEELLVNELVDLLDGETLEVKQPYYGDFSMLNQKAVSPLIIKGVLAVTPAENRKNSLEVHPSDKEKAIQLVFNKNGNVITGEQLPVTVRLKVNNMDAFTDGELTRMGMDIANPNNLKVELIVEFEKGKPQTHIFNDSKNDVSLGGVNDRVWYMKPVVPYVARVGLFNGMLNLPKNTLSRDEKQDILQVGAIASQILQESPEFELAEENHFGLGMIIKPQPGLKSIKAVKRMSERDANPQTITNGVKFYCLDKANNKFTLHTGTTFEPTEIYLATIDYYIDGSSVGEVPDQSFDLGFDVVTTETSTENGAVEKQDFWGIKVQTVEKPEHF